MKTNNPTVSIVLPVYNGEDYLRYAVDSILDQSFTDFELLIINDGSSDSSADIIDAYAQKDSRIVAIHQKNLGLVATLNKAVELSKASLIARMDADDISLPRRLETQVDLFKKNPNAVLCGSCFDVINEYNEFLKLSVAPAFSRDLKRSLHLYNPIAHGSVMFKKEAFLKAGGYSGTVGPTEDYDLWIRLAELGDFIYSERSLFKWRINPEGITHSNNDVMQAATKKLVQKYRKENPVAPLSRSEVSKIGKKYVESFGAIGVIMKEVFLEDTYNIGIKSLKEGKPFDGVRHIFSMALTGRTGLKIAFSRTIEYSFAKIRR